MTNNLRRRVAAAALALGVPAGAAALATDTTLLATTAVGGDPHGAPHTVPIPQPLELLLEIEDPYDSNVAVPRVATGEIAAR